MTDKDAKGKKHDDGLANKNVTKKEQDAAMAFIKRCQEERNGKPSRRLTSGHCNARYRNDHA